MSHNKNEKEIYSVSQGSADVSVHAISRKVALIMRNNAPFYKAFSRKKKFLSTIWNGFEACSCI
jgi:hypothetical protein